MKLSRWHIALFVEVVGWFVWRKPKRVARQNFGGTATPEELAYTAYKTSGGTLNFDGWAETNWLLGFK